MDTSEGPKQLVSQTVVFDPFSCFIWYNFCFSIPSLPVGPSVGAREGGKERRRGYNGICGCLGDEEGKTIGQGKRKGKEEGEGLDWISFSTFPPLLSLPPPFLLRESDVI